MQQAKRGWDVRYGGRWNSRLEDVFYQKKQRRFAGLAHGLKCVGSIAAWPFRAFFRMIDKLAGQDENEWSTLALRYEQETPVPKRYRGTGYRTPERESRKKRRRKMGGIVAAVMAVCCVAGGLWYLLEGRFCRLTVWDEDQAYQLRTAQATVEAALEEGGICVGRNDLLSTAADAPVEADMVVYITRSSEVSILHPDGVTDIALAGGTVRDALREADISVDNDDEITPSLNTPLSKGMEISVVYVDVEYVTHQETIPYETVVQEDASLLQGNTTVSQAGRSGMRETTERIIYRNGEEAEREVVSSVVTEEAVDRVVQKGTKIPPTPTPTPKPTPVKTAKPVKTPGKTNTTTSTVHKEGGVYDKVANLPAGGPTADMIAKTMVISDVTAYTHTGNKTATGKWPQVGMVGANPKVLPYGTYLYVPGYGYCVVEDRGGYYPEGTTTLDLFMNTREECFAWGRHKNVTVYVLNIQ